MNIHVFVLFSYLRCHVLPDLCHFFNIMVLFFCVNSRSSIHVLKTVFPHKPSFPPIAQLWWLSGERGGLSMLYYILKLCTTLFSCFFLSNFRFNSSKAYGPPEPIKLWLAFAIFFLRTLFMKCRLFCFIFVKTFSFVTLSFHMIFNIRLYCVF